MQLEQRTIDNFSFNLIHFPAKSSSNELLVLFPGAGYNVMGPLLYYPTQWALAKNYSVVMADYDFRHFKATANLDHVSALRHCVSETLTFAKRFTGETSRTRFIGKSIGTRALCYVEDEAEKTGFNLGDSKFVWLTPAWKEPEYFDVMSSLPRPSLFVIGDDDPYYSPDLVDQIGQKPNARVVVCPGADHSLDIDSDYDKTLQTHQRVFREMYEFLGAHA